MTSLVSYLIKISLKSNMVIAYFGRCQNILSRIWTTNIKHWHNAFTRMKMGSNGIMHHSWDIRLDNETKKLFLINSTEKSLNPWNVPVDIIILIKLVVLRIFILRTSFPLETLLLTASTLPQHRQNRQEVAMTWISLTWRKFWKSFIQKFFLLL